MFSIVSTFFLCNSHVCWFETSERMKKEEEEGGGGGNEEEKREEEEQFTSGWKNSIRDNSPPCFNIINKNTITFVL